MNSNFTAFPMPYLCFSMNFEKKSTSKPSIFLIPPVGIEQQRMLILSVVFSNTDHQLFWYTYNTVNWLNVQHFNISPIWQWNRGTYFHIACLGPHCKMLGNIFTVLWYSKNKRNWERTGLQIIWKQVSILEKS